MSRTVAAAALAAMAVGAGLALTGRVGLLGGLLVAAGAYGHVIERTTRQGDATPA